MELRDVADYRVFKELELASEVASGESRADGSTGHSEQPSVSQHCEPLEMKAMG